MPTLSGKRSTHLVAYQVAPKEAWRIVVQDRWRDLCFDAAAVHLDGQRHPARAKQSLSHGRRDWLRWPL
jgi:hypothetical protein